MHTQKDTGRLRSGFLQAPHIDRTDFLNGAMREKKRFENTLDDSVAGGLNTGTDLLMKQVRKFVPISTSPLTRSGGGAYYRG